MKEGKISIALLLLLISLYILFLFTGCSKNQPTVQQEPTTFTIPVVYGDGRSDTLKSEDIFKDEAEAKLQSISLQNILEESPSKIAIYTTEGKIIESNTADCTIYPNGQIKVHNETISHIAGLMIDPPAKSVMDVATLTEEFLAKDQKVLVLFLDGFSWFNYEKAKADNLIPTICQFENIQKAATVFPPLTSVAYSAMVSGQTLFVTGVKDRKTHILNCETIFDKAKAKGKKTCVIEGNVQIIELAGEVILNSDLNGNGLTDDEVYSTTMEKLNNNYDLLFVHFHGIDDTSHEYGPNSAQTYERIAAIDKKIAHILQNWEGKVIITADHGQHPVNETGRKGNHGDFCPEDMFIPFIVGEVKK
jgi:hypothetical protein